MSKSLPSIEARLFEELSAESLRVLGLSGVGVTPCTIADGSPGWAVCITVLGGGTVMARPHLAASVLLGCAAFRCTSFNYARLHGVWACEIGLAEGGAIVNLATSRRVAKEGELGEGFALFVSTLNAAAGRLRSKLNAIDLAKAAKAGA